MSKPKADKPDVYAICSRINTECTSEVGNLRLPILSLSVDNIRTKYKIDDWHPEQGEDFADLMRVWGELISFELAYVQHQAMQQIHGAETPGLYGKDSGDMTPMTPGNNLAALKPEMKKGIANLG